jgi:anaerobic magnesium-protoporphyrin IX monomethyl ester cyclase
MATRLLFVEPPKDYWFVMGEYLPPPTGLLALAAYVERELPGVEIGVVDCQAEGKGWPELQKSIESYAPSIVATSGFTCNAYVCAKVAELAKKVDERIVTIVGGQHFSAVPEESLKDFPEIDYIVRGEGEQTLVELIMALEQAKGFSDVRGLSFKNNGGILHTPPRPLIEDLDSLPFPAYHFLGENVGKYHFTMMAGRNTRYMILEGARGCNFKCSFCTQWRHWGGTWRTKSAKRIADEMQHLHEDLGGKFLWLTDDNFDYARRGKALWEELKGRDFSREIDWFCQARMDDIVRYPDLVAKLHEVGNNWILMGVESDSPERLKEFKKGVQASQALQAVKILNDNGIFSQSMLIIGSRKDTQESIEQLRRFSLGLDTNWVIYTVLTPFPGTDIHQEAMHNGWLEDRNFAHYDMSHAIMPTETLSRKEVQQELYQCYRDFYGSVVRALQGLFARNMVRRRAYRHMAKMGVLRSLRGLI